MIREERNILGGDSIGDCEEKHGLYENMSIWIVTAIYLFESANTKAL